MGDRQSEPRLNRRDVAGAWLVCAVVAALALGLMSGFPPNIPSAATTATACSPSLLPACPLSPELAARRGSGETALRLLALPTGPSGEHHRHG
jgi:hypothetical protein